MLNFTKFTLIAITASSVCAASQEVIYYHHRDVTNDQEITLDTRTFGDPSIKAILDSEKGALFFKVLLSGAIHYSFYSTYKASRAGNLSAAIGAALSGIGIELLSGLISSLHRTSTLTVHSKGEVESETTMVTVSSKIPFKLIARNMAIEALIFALIGAASFKNKPVTATA
jgi:hypothetical protein